MQVQAFDSNAYNLSGNSVKIRLGIPRQSSSVRTADELHRRIFLVSVINGKPDGARARGLEWPVRRVFPPHIRCCTTPAHERSSALHG